MSTSEDTGAEVGGVELVEDGSSKTEPEVKDEGEKVGPKDEVEQETVKDVNDRVEEPAEMREGRGTVTVEVKEVWKEEPTETEDQLDDGLPAEISAMAVVPTKEDAESEVQEEEKKTKLKKKSISLVKLFSYATPLDWFLMFIGTICAICHGITLPAFSILFGNFINIFISQAVTQRTLFLLDANSSNNLMVNCMRLVDPLYVNLTVLDASIRAPNIMELACPTLIRENSTLNFIVRSCSAQAACVSNMEFIEGVNRLVYIFIGIAVAVFILAYLEILLFEIADERQVKKIRLAFFKAIMKQEIGWFDAHSSGELSSMIVDDIDKIRDGLGDKVALMINAFSAFLAGFIIAFVIEWRLALLLLAFIPLLALAALAYTKLATSLSGKELKEYASAGNVAEEVLSAVRTVVAFGGEQKECNRYNEKLKEARLIGAKKGGALGLNVAIIFFLFFSIYAVSFWFGAFLASRGITQGGTVLIVFFALMTGSFSLGQAIPNFEVILTAAGAAESVFEIIKRKSILDPSSEEGEKPETYEGTIEFENIAFSYPTRPEVQIMENFNLTVEAGKTYAMVGPSGCGKSTVIQLIQRFYDPDAGKVRLGGKDIKSLNIKWLRNHIGLVAQEPVLFDTTIAENILYGTEDATIEDVKEAARNANAHDFISKLPKGYDTPVGEGGTQLSGGQKQRIAIARALIRDPKILLLDEATSALDAESESIVQQALDRARAGRTTIVIAHRLSTIQNADVIVSIEKGSVVEKGTHLELMDKEGLYFDLVTTQSQGVDEGAHAMGPGELLSYRERKQSRLTSDPFEQLERQDSQGRKKPLLQRQSTSEISSETSKGRRVTGLLNYTNSLLNATSVDAADKPKDEIPETSILRLMKENGPEWWLIVLGLIGAAVNGAIFPAFSVFFGGALQVFSMPPNLILPNIHLWAGLLLIIAVVSAVSNFLKILCFTISGENLTSRLREKTFKAMLRQEIGWFDDEKNSSGALVTRLADDAAKVQGATGSRLGTLLEIIFGMVVAFAISFGHSWVLTFVVLLIVPIMFISSALEVTALANHATKNKKALEKAGVIAVESISHIRTVSSFGLQERFYGIYETNVVGPYRQALVNTAIHSFTYAFSQGIQYILFAIVFRFGAFQITLPMNSPAHANFQQVIVVFSALVFGAAGAGQAGAFAPNYAKAKIAANSIFFLLDREPLIDTYSEKGEQPDKLLGDISANDLVFHYPTRPNVRVLRGLNVSIKSGQTLALVGPSGCGKSTIVSLLERFYNPIAGTLTLDGTDISDLNITWLRSRIGIVLQEPTLFDCSIADNIRYGANFKEVSQDEVIQAAKDANIHNFISSLPKGYDTNVGSKGAQLSGGQKQRVAIARALVRNPTILLLDEATSALDTESEKIVQEALDKAREGRTSIVIAHRLSTIFNSNCIAVISGGKVAESGTHAELMEKDGIYKKLNHFQKLK